VLLHPEAARERRRQSLRKLDCCRVLRPSTIARPFWNERINSTARTPADGIMTLAGLQNAAAAIEGLGAR